MSAARLCVVVGLAVALFVSPAAAFCAFNTGSSPVTFMTWPVSGQTFKKVVQPGQSACCNFNTGTDLGLSPVLLVGPCLQACALYIGCFLRIASCPRVSVLDVRILNVGCVGQTLARPLRKVRTVPTPPREPIRYLPCTQLCKLPQALYAFVHAGLSVLPISAGDVLLSF